MSDFSIDERLLADCSVLTESAEFSYLLQQNAEVAWFILLPHTRKTEFYQLGASLQNQVCIEINRVSDFILSQFSVDKINVATIGNVVSQMHIHVIGRRMDDAYWPDVVWGKPAGKKYKTSQIDKLRQQFISHLHK